jgi:uroporphyrinogen-III decarboxylase
VRLEQGKTAAQLVEEKENRIMNAIRLKPTDRVPIICGMGYFPARYAGIPSSAAYYDYPAWYGAYKKTLRDYHADLVFPQPFTPGKALEILDPKQTRWPGHGVDPYRGHQAIEVETMQAEDYAAYLADPSDYMFRIHLSRASDNLLGLASLPRLTGMSGSGGAQMLAMAFTSPQMAHTVEVLLKVGKELRRWQPRIEKFNQMMIDMGFPQYFQGSALPPFDIVSHSMRGMAGTMMDMFRQPDKLVAVCDLILKQTIERPIARPNKFGNIRYFMTNTRGSDDFMSKKQFDTFYWPTMKKLLLFLIEKGVTPCMFFEGNFTSRLEYLLELPKGKMLARLDTTDIQRAKDVLKGHMCIQGNVPSSLLQTGTVDDVKAYCKGLIDTVGKGGGFILSPRSSTDEVKPDNLRAMIDFTQQYGRYN